MGGAIVYYALTAYMNSGLEYMNAATITSSVEILKTLRSGDTQHGYDMLEMRLDGAIIMFYHLPRLTKEGLNAIEAAKGYRRQYPFEESNTNVENAVREVLR